MFKPEVDLDQDLGGNQAHDHHNSSVTALPLGWESNPQPSHNNFSVTATSPMVEQLRVVKVVGLSPTFSLFLLSD